MRITTNPQHKFFFNSSEPDSDQDGLTDLVETGGWNITLTSEGGTETLQVSSDPWLEDTDFDGLTDYQEYVLHTNPGFPDTDSDGLSDLFEHDLNTSPVNRDTDADGLEDGMKIAIGSNTLAEDADGDGLTDHQEYDLGTSPVQIDSDVDGLTDFLEVSFNSSPLKPDTDTDLLFDNREFVLGTDPNKPDSDQDGIEDGQEEMLGTDPLSPDTDCDGIEDGDEIELLTDPLDADTDDDGLTDFQEGQFGTNPLSPDSNNNGTADADDPVTYKTHVPNVFVLYDKETVEYRRLIQNLSRYTQVTAGTILEIPDFQSMPYIILLGYPSESAGPVSRLIWDLLSNEPETRNRMIESDQYRFASGINTWDSNEMLIILSQLYHSDAFRILASLKSLEYEITGNSVRLTYPTARNFFSLEALKELGFYFEVDLISRATPSIKITRYDQLSTPQSLSMNNGLPQNYLDVAKYMEIQVSDNVQSDDFSNIKRALFKVYYSLSDLDLNGDGDCADYGDIDENTLCLYRWSSIKNCWEKLSDLEGFNNSGVNAANITLNERNYEGFVWAEVGHFSLYALAGQTHQAVFVPGISLPGNILLLLLFSVSLFWLERRRLEHRRQAHQENWFGV